MHILQPKHTKLKPDEAVKILEKYNLSLTQLPKIKLGDPGLPEGCQIGDVIKIERKARVKTLEYYRVIIAK